MASPAGLIQANLKIRLDVVQKTSKDNAIQNTFDPSLALLNLELKRNQNIVAKTRNLPGIRFWFLLMIEQI